MSLLIKCYPSISGGAVSPSLNEGIYKKGVSIEQLMMWMNGFGGA